MIYEVRTYRLTVGGQAEFVERFGEAYEKRKRHSELAAFLLTTVGPLNEVIHVWPYESFAHRAEVRAAAPKDGGWPPKAGHTIVHETAEVFLPTPFTPVWNLDAKGPVYEWRSYSLTIGGVAKLIEEWKGVIDARTAFSPLAMAMYSEFGPVNKFVNVWPYASVEHRAEVGGKTAAAKVWAGAGDAHTITQENRLCVPAPFSPAQ